MVRDRCTREDMGKHQRPFGSKSRARAANGVASVRKRSFRPVKDTEVSTGTLKCQLCFNDLSTLLGNRDVGRFQPCGHLFCFSGRPAGVCVGVHDWLMYRAAKDEPQWCPLCKEHGTKIQRIGPLGVVQREDAEAELPLKLPGPRKVQLRDPSKLASCGVKGEELILEADTSVPASGGSKREVLEAIRDDESAYRGHVLLAMCDRGMVEELATHDAVVRLGAVMRRAAGVTANRRDWFTSSMLADASDNKGGTIGMAEGGFAAVAACCGSCMCKSDAAQPLRRRRQQPCAFDTPAARHTHAAECPVCHWGAAERVEAMSWAACRLADEGVIPRSQRGRLLKPSDL